jgi:ketosteroid isomerase-like protein
MSQENVEVVLSAIEAFNRRDLATATRDTVADIEVDWSRSSGVEAGVYRGRAATWRFWSTFLDAFDPILVTPEEVLVRGESVVVVDRTRFWGRDGIEVEAHNVFVVTLRDGLIATWTMYRDRAEALKAVGLEE